MRQRCKNADEGVILVAIQIAVDSDLSTEERCLRVQHTCSPVTSPTPCSSKGEGEVGEDSIQQQHNGMVVMEERGTPAGLRQALRETRRERGRAAPRERETRVSGNPKTPTI